MATTYYTTYQCSVCRRKKDILNDNVRASPNECIITKGCRGKLFNIGQTTAPTVTPPVAGLVDWYPRGTVLSPKPIISAQPTVTLSCSKTGVLTLAVYQPDAQALANPTLMVTFNQQRVQDISYQQYLFTTNAPTTSVTGRDSTGKIMRFDTTAISEGLVFVLVNGVARFPGTASNEIVLTTNTITFNTSLPAGTVVSVAVYLESNVIQRTYPFVLSESVTSTLGSWGNVKWAKEYQTSGALKPYKWWLYTCSSLGAIETGAQLQLDGIFLPLVPPATVPTSIVSTSTITSLIPSLSDVRFLLSSIPHENTDRYLNFYVDPVVLSEGYALSSLVTGSVTELYADTAALVEIYPPLQLVKPSSFISPDTFTTVTSIPTDLGDVRLSGTKIIGPT